VISAFGFRLGWFFRAVQWRNLNEPACCFSPFWCGAGFRSHCFDRYLSRVLLHRAFAVLTCFVLANTHVAVRLSTGFHANMLSLGERCSSSCSKHIRTHFLKVNHEGQWTYVDCCDFGVQPPLPLTLLHMFNNLLVYHGVVHTSLIIFLFLCVVNSGRLLAGVLLAKSMPR
jgi:hypothetical protein